MLTKNLVFLLVIFDRITPKLMKVIHIFWCFLLFLTNLAAQQPAPIITYKKGVIEKNLVLHKTDNKFYYRYENATFRENYDATSLISYLFERHTLHSGLYDLEWTLIFDNKEELYAQEVLQKHFLVTPLCDSLKEAAELHTFWETNFKYEHIHKSIFGEILGGSQVFLCGDTLKLLFPIQGYFLEIPQNALSLAKQVTQYITDEYFNLKIDAGISWLCGEVLKMDKIILPKHYQPTTNAQKFRVVLPEKQ
jgi:hypothetical protein